MPAATVSAALQLPTAAAAAALPPSASAAPVAAAVAAAGPVHVVVALLPTQLHQNTHISLDEKSVYKEIPIVYFHSGLSAYDARKA